MAACRWANITRDPAQCFSLPNEGHKPITFYTTRTTPLFFRPPAQHQGGVLRLPPYAVCLLSTDLADRVRY